MEMVKQSPANLTRLARVDDVWQGILSDVLKRGFHGRASVEVQIVDGTIQRITQSVIRVEK
jgi:hypothetical protein